MTTPGTEGGTSMDPTAGGHNTDRDRRTDGGGRDRPSFGGGASGRSAAGRGRVLSSRVQRASAFAFGIYVTVGLGTAFTLILFAAFVPRDAAQLREPLVPAAAVVLLLGPLVATGISVFLGRQLSEGRPWVVSGLVNALGFGVTFLILGVIAIDRGAGVNVFHQVLGPLLGGVIGVGVTGAVGAAVGQQYDP